MGMEMFYGPVSRCSACRNSEGLDQSCGLCFSRGFVAQCMRCSGSGSYTEAIAGGPGSLKVTCAPCGGRGTFAVNKPANWVEPVPETPKGELHASV